MGAFSKVRDAFASHAQHSLELLGVQSVGKRPSGDWLSVKCPLCSDSSGSCSISVASGFLRCHQCGQREDLFKWFKSFSNLASDWDACKEIAKTLHVNVEPAKRRGKAPKVMEPDLLMGCHQVLFESEEAKACREFLQARQIYDPVMLETLGVGFLAGTLVFAQFSAEGALRPRYRRYTPAGHSKWGWSSGRGDTMGFWPGIRAPEKAEIWILEGEFDVMTAWIRLQLQKQGIFTYTWTGGAGSPVKAHLIPEWMRRRKISICYDNDTYQGPDWSTHRAPDDRKKLEMKRRRDNLISGVARSFKAQECKVMLMAVPIDPLENWGGDFRDWVDAGGRNLDDIPGDHLKQVGETAIEVIEADFNEVYRLAGQHVRFHAMVNTLNQDGVVMPNYSLIDCNMGSEQFCGRCKAPILFPTGLMYWEDMPEELVAALLSRDPEKHIHQKIIGKPSACTFCRIRPQKYAIGCSWTAMKDDVEEVSDKELIIVSEDTPTLSGDIEVEGRVFHHEKSVVVYADKLTMLDNPEVDLEPHIFDLKSTCPTKTDDIDRIERYLQDRTSDLANNVTHIYGRSEIHIAAELLAHSAIGFNMDHSLRRGWLDISCIGETRVGKSVVFSSLMDYHGLGRMHTCMENISRAGLTMGAMSGGKRDSTRLKPGLFPRCHKKMLALDEFHLMVERSVDNPILHLQSARDVGTVGGVKIYGSRTLAAKVRLAVIGNYARGRKEAFEFPCEHFLYYYGVPESLSRLDFGLVVEGDPTEFEYIETPHFWTSERMRVMILRAWAMTPEMIHITKEAEDLARQYCMEWRDLYADKLPLFTSMEKIYSLMRTAIACANICLSYPGENVYECEVRPVHVHWAANWYTKLWALSGYDRYSNAVFSRREVRRPFTAEAKLTVSLGITDVDDAKSILSLFFSTVSRQDIQSHLGLDIYDIDKWISGMVRLNVLEKSRDANAYHTSYQLTPGGHMIMKNILTICDEYPDEYHRRYSSVETWLAGGAIGEPKDLPPLNLPTRQLRYGWEKRYGDSDGASDIIQHPKSG